MLSSLKRASAALVLGAGRKPPELPIPPSRSAPPLLCGVIDTIAAVLILYGLALTLALILAAINALGAVPLLPLDRLFRDLADPAIRGGYAWFYLTPLSTLVPTGVHLILALISMTTLLPRAAKRWFIDRIRANPEASLPALVLLEPRQDLHEIARPVAVVELRREDRVPGVTAGPGRAG